MGQLLLEVSHLRRNCFNCGPRVSPELVGPFTRICWRRDFLGTGVEPFLRGNQTPATIVAEIGSVVEQPQDELGASMWEGD